MDYNLKNTVIVPPLPEVNLTNNIATDRSPKGIKVEDGDNRLHENVSLDSITSIDFKVLGKDTDGDLSVFISSNNLKGTGPALHVHPDLDETFYILEGEIKFKVGDELFYLKAGDSIFLPRKVTHAFTITGDTPAKMLIVVQPAGKMEEFFRACSKYDRVTSEIAAKLMQEHNMEVVGPPLIID